MISALPLNGRTRPERSIELQEEPGSISRDQERENLIMQLFRENYLKRSNEIDRRVKKLQKILQKQETNKAKNS